MSLRPDKTLIFTPGSADDTLRFFGAIARRMDAGLDCRVGVLESPFRPGGRFGINEDTASQPVVTEPDELLEWLEPGTFVFLTLQGLTAIREISKQDGLAVVDGGARLIDLEREAGREGLSFAFSPSLIREDMTIAEIIMDGEFTRTEGRFGKLREQVLSIEVATPTGKLLHAGSRAVKDVGGYELASFVIGSGARCGLIMGATLRLHPMPKTRIILGTVGTAMELTERAKRLREHFRPAFLEIYEGGAAVLLARGTGAEHFTAPCARGEQSLLVTEVYEPGAGRENVLTRAMHDVIGAELSSITFDSRVIERIRRFPQLVLQDGGMDTGLVHLAYDAGPAPEEGTGALVSRSLYPQRYNVFVPFSWSPGGEGGRFGELTAAVPRLEVFIRRVAGSGLRERFAVIERRDGQIVRWRIAPDEFEGFITSREDRRDELEDSTIGRGHRQLSLDERVYRVFDPLGIMLS